MPQLAMVIPLWIIALLCASTYAAFPEAHDNKPELARNSVNVTDQVDSIRLQSPQDSKLPFLTSKSLEFKVNNTNLPKVDVDIGESYAGQLPTGDQSDNKKLFFWFFPSRNPSAKKEIVIWLSGGPGCSSTGELLRGNGPTSWLPATLKPVLNEWSWHKLTNVVWIDQPVGTGFSTGQVTATNDTDVANQFMGSWKNFVDSFALEGYKIYITGSSYSGMYAPYIASAMLDTEDKNCFNLVGLQIFDGLFSNFQLASNIPIAGFTEAWGDNIALNDTVRQLIKDQAQKCGYSEYMRQYLVFPPKDQQPSILPGVQKDGTLVPGCDIGNPVIAAARDSNPCFSIYDVSKHCPLPYDPLGFNDGIPYSLNSANPVYFNRTDVKAAIHAPVDVDWAFCTQAPVFVNGIDRSLATGSRDVLASVIDRTKNVIIGHGMLDLALPANGTLLVIQNMTWGGKLGFQTRPSEPLYVPYRAGVDPASWAGAGVVGTSHSERGLTYMAVAEAGHFLGMDAPAVAYRSLEVLLGRVDDLKAKVPFTTDQASTPQPPGPMGQGTVTVGMS